MLTQDHTTAAHKTRDENGHAEPAERIEIEQQAVGGQSTCHTTGTSCVNGNLPPQVDDEAGTLNEKRAH